MFDGIGVCEICAKICHRNHDVSYAKYGLFFCDCGAKKNKSCMAMATWNRSLSTNIKLPEPKGSKSIRFWYTNTFQWNQREYKSSTLTI